MKSKDPWAGYRFIGGNLALDFVNTLANRLAPKKRREYLRGDSDLLRWVRLAGIDAGHRRPIPTREAVRLREALYRILAAHLKAQPPRKPDIGLLNRFLRRARASWKLQGGKTMWQWQWAGAGGISYPLARIAESAAKLLTSGDLKLLRRCGDAHCGWLFLDRSQGRRRKWCSMQDCGNRAKVRRFFAKRASTPK